MASSLRYFNAVTNPLSLKRSCTSQALQIKAQSFRDGGRRRVSIVDANLILLRERIEEVVIKERLERCCRCENGWNYASGHGYKLKKQKELRELLELVRVVGATIGFTCFSGTVFLCLVSILVRLHH